MNLDLDLIRSVLAGDPAAFGTLVTTYQDRLFQMLVQVTGSRQDAEDIAQETFIQAYQKLAHFAGKSEFYTWLYRIAINRWLSRRRRRRVEYSIDDLRERNGVEPASAEARPDGKLERDEQVHLVRAALERLSDDYRTILVLREFEGCDYDTLAEMLDLPPGTVRSRIHRARLELKRQLELMFNERV